MGKSARSLHPPYPPPPPPPRLPPADEAVIAPGQAIRYEQNFLGGRGVELEIKNLGPGACEFEGPTGLYVLRAGKTAMLSVLDNTREFDLEIDSARGARVRITLIAWRPAPPPRRVLGVKKSVVRNEKTKLIEAVVQTPVWVVEEAP